MATTNLIRRTVGKIEIQNGNGTPTHTSPIGSKYVDSNSGIEYINDDGNVLWSENISYQNVTVVRKQADFPSEAGGVITLEIGETYVINGTIMTSYPLKISNGSSIRGNHGLTDKIIYTGTTSLFTSSEGANSVFRNMQVAAPYGKIYDMTDASKTASLYILDVLHVSSQSVGSFSGYQGVNFLTNLFKFNHNGLEFDNCDCVVINNTKWGFNSGQTLSFTGRSTTNKATIQSNIFNCSNTDIESAIVISELVPFEVGNVVGNVFVGFSGSSAISGVTISDSPNWQFFSNSGTENEVSVPTFTESQIYGFNNPTSGTLVFDETSNKINYFDGAKWQELTSTEKQDILFEDGFESGNFTSSGWTVVNDTTNLWVVGSAEATGGTYSAYISDDGGTTATYNITTSQVSHFYRDIFIPTGVTSEFVTVQVRFDWKCYGEDVTYDYGKVYWAPTGVTPVAGTLVSTDYGIGETVYNVASAVEVQWRSESIALETTGGTSYRLIFSWRNDNSVGNDPPMCVDNVKVYYVPE